jgi:hypothetical protein
MFLGATQSGSRRQAMLKRVAGNSVAQQAGL